MVRVHGATKILSTWPEKMDNGTIKIGIHMERDIQYDLFEPIILFVMCKL